MRFLNHTRPFYLRNSFINHGEHGSQLTEARFLPAIRALPALFQPVIRHIKDRVDLRTVIFSRPSNHRPL